MSIVDLRAAVVAYDGLEVLHGVDLRVEAGEVVALLGANGSGKTTLVRALVGLVPLAGGTLELFGEPLATFRSWPRLGYVPQRVGAGSGVAATVREVVGTGRLAQRPWWRARSSDDRAAVSHALATVGLADRAGDSVGTLSGGQQQRVLIARALAARPDLLVLDEPTAGVDLASQETLAGTLAGLAAGGVTILLVAHELGPLAGVVSRCVVLRGGRVVHDGPPPGPEQVHRHDPDHSHPDHSHAGDRAVAHPSSWGLS